ncbi:MAG: choice-of-anchor I family protein, partial [Cyanobacteria bacterium J06592_8]
MTSNLLTQLGTYSTGIFDESAAEISAFDPSSQRLFITNGATDQLDILSLTNPSNPVKIGEIDLSDFGVGANSVAVKNGIVVAAVEAEDGLTEGQAVFFDIEGNLINAVTVGILPDMITFNKDGSQVLVANEAQPVDEGDPEGSVSIIDLSGGVENLTQADVSTADFSQFVGREEELRGRGVRIFPGVTAAEDFEPEYIAVSEDNTTAFVTLQENNTVAVVDLETAEVTDLQPLGLKDFSRGLPELTQYPWNLSEEVLGTTPAGQEILLGGMSGLYFEGIDAEGKLEFIVTPDRGPNGNPTDVDGDGLNERPFALPDYQTQLIRFTLDQDSSEIDITDQILLTREDGVTPVTGLPNLQAGDPGSAYTDEEPVDLFGNTLENDPFGADMESIIVASDNTFWMSDEYRPAIYHFTEEGVLIDRFVPEGTAEAAGEADGFFGTETIPEVYAQRRINRGFEGMALDTDNNKLYAWIQSPIDNPDVSNAEASELGEPGDFNSRNSQVLRILEFDPVTKEATGEYIHFLEGSAGVDKIGDAVYEGDGKFLIIERDSGVDATSKKFIFEIDFAGATNILGTELSEATGEDALEGKTADDLVELGVQAVTKTKITNLPSLGYVAGDKSEGLALLPDGSLAVINDNDFGLLDEPIASDGSVPFNPDPVQTILGVIEFSGSNGLDASDRDDTINIANWPVYGMYMPDSIATFDIDGETYYVTANEGDDRGEDERIADLTLDPIAFPNAEELQQDENLGRLGVSSLDGDIDGDGDFDQLWSYGARSMSIWDSEGNLVFDSGDQIAQIAAEQFPESFNSNGNESSFDGRSDNKGIEPEGVTVGVVGDRTYAFVGLERMGGVVVYDVSEPSDAEFVQYINPINSSGDPEAGTAGDLAPEGLVFVNAEESPSGRPLLVVTNEVSGTTTTYDFGSSQIEGTPEVDELVGTDEDDLLTGMAGNDTVAGGLGNDAIFGNEGDDVLRGDNNSRSTGGTVGGDDKIFGGEGDDRIGGKAGDDELFG